ncbi:hypothetical protein [Flavobacterium sp.]|uniref:hypothetical protein n=1 Tax=Flavobacterium sp. TaxID=239 RepID=UPI00391892BA
MDFLLKKIIKFKTLYLIGVFRDTDGDVYSLLKIKNRNNQLDIIDSFTFSDFDSLKTQLDQSIPVLVLIDGKGVLNKTIDLKNSADVDWVKNLDYKSIHFTCYKDQEVEFLCFCRKNVVEEYIEVFSKTEIQVLDFYVGSLPSVLMRSVIEKSSYYSNQVLLQFDGETLLDFKKVESGYIKEDYKLGDRVISNFHLPLYGLAIHFYVNDKSFTKSNIDGVSYDEIIYRRGFEKLGLGMLVGFFILLLTSYLLIQYFINKNALLNLENSYSNKSYDMIKGLEDQRDNKFRILNETGFSSKKFITYYCYEITKSTPQEISFSLLDVYPLKNEVKNNKKIEVNYKTISIIGQTTNKSVFNTWVDYLKTQKWIKLLEIVSIKRDKKDLTFFELKITIADV